MKSRTSGSGGDECKRVAIVTVGRSDFSLLRPLAKALLGDPQFDVGFWVGGAHFEGTSGRTVDMVRSSGVPMWAEIDAEDHDRSELGVAISTGEQVKGFAGAVGRGIRPDLVIILGDRYEAVAAGLAMAPFNVPIAHISGGSVTEGAMDDAFRHCLTKLSVLHFCDLPEFARRIHRMGESPTSIFAVGALGLDGIDMVPAMPLVELVEHFDLPKFFDEGYVVATLHPETRAPELTAEMAGSMVAALSDSGMQVIYTYPNADPGRDLIIEEIETAAALNPHHAVVRNFGPDWYNTAMKHASLMVGNSSGGIIEAASFGLPVVNIGGRQKGRYRGKNVIDCNISEVEIAKAVAGATEERFLREARNMSNPYGDGRAIERILKELHEIDWMMLKEPKPFSEFDPAYTGKYEETV